MTLKLGKIIKKFKEFWSKLPDKRKKSNRTTYTMSDAAMSAFAVFFMQCPSFLAFQRDMKKKKKRSNAETLFEIESPGLEIIHMKSCDKLFVFTIQEIISNFAVVLWPPNCPRDSVWWLSCRASLCGLLDRSGGTAKGSL